MTTRLFPPKPFWNFRCFLNLWFNNSLIKIWLFRPFLSPLKKIPFADHGFLTEGVFIFFFQFRDLQLSNSYYAKNCIHVPPPWPSFACQKLFFFIFKFFGWPNPSLRVNFGHSCALAIILASCALCRWYSSFKFNRVSTWQFLVKKHYVCPWMSKIGSVKNQYFFNFFLIKIYVQNLKFWNFKISLWLKCCQSYNLGCK